MLHASHNESLLILSAVFHCSLMAVWPTLKLNQHLLQLEYKNMFLNKHISIQNLKQFLISDHSITMSCVESLLADLERVMENEATSDIKIVCQDQEIKVHKLILSAR